MIKANHVTEPAPVQRDPVDESCNGESERPNIRTAIVHDTRMARYLMVRLININSLIMLKSLMINPNGLRLFNNSNPLVCALLIMGSMLKTFPSILDEQIYSSITHSENRIFWWDDFM